MEILYHHILTPCGEPADIIISALQKFIRRGKTEEAARAAYELYLSGEELRDYLWQRLLVISAEDVGLGQPAAPSVVLSLYHASQKLGADSMDYPLFFVHAVRYLCSCPKERGSSTLASLTKRRIRDRVPFPLPDYVFDMHTIKGQNRGRSYEHFISQAAVVFPEAVLNDSTAGQNDRWEAELTERRKGEEDI